MRFTWHEAKRESNLKDHGLDFVDAREVFAGPTFTYQDDRFDYSKERLVTLGLLRGIVVSIVHTETPRRIHIISFRKATKHEQAIFFKNL
ncbi:MAG TPA: BrnT family toxin [Terriglobia bacterium]|nr:BrnT family toxin [Terriglobia bacterium]